MCAGAPLNSIRCMMKVNVTHTPQNRTPQGQPFSGNTTLATIHPANAAEADITIHSSRTILRSSQATLSVISSCVMLFPPTLSERRAPHRRFRQHHARLDAATAPRTGSAPPAYQPTPFAGYPTIRPRRPRSLAARPLCARLITRPYRPCAFANLARSAAAVAARASPPRPSTPDGIPAAPTEWTAAGCRGCRAHPALPALVHQQPDLANESEYY
jgi:hypothetical protein